jgi:hypothetical protein
LTLKKGKSGAEKKSLKKKLFELYRIGNQPFPLFLDQIISPRTSAFREKAPIPIFGHLKNFYFKLQSKMPIVKNASLWLWSYPQILE